MKQFSLALFAAMIFSTVPASSNADEYSRIVNEAIVIQDKSVFLAEETAHYVNTPGYGLLSRMVWEQNRLAERVQQIAVREGSIYLLDRELERLEHTFHRVENMFDRIEESAARGCGHVVGNTRHVKKLLNHVERCIRKMQRDVKRIRRRTERCEQEAIAPVYPRPSQRPVYNFGHDHRFGSDRYGNDRFGAYRYGSHGAYGSGRGINLGNEHFSLTFGF